MNKVFKKINLLSLDVVVGAMISSVVFWRLPDGNGKINFMALFILGVATWLIYILDRLLDVRKTLPLSSIRHQFHQNNQSSLSKIVILLFLLAAILTCFLPRRIILFGLIVSAFVGIYLFTLNTVAQGVDYQWIKESVVAVVYGLSVVGGAYIMKEKIIISEWMLAINFFLIAWQNLLLFSLFEWYENNQAINIVKKLGRENTKRLIYVIFGVVLLIILYLSVNKQPLSNYAAKVIFVELLMSAILLIINLLPQYFLKNERYRWAADGVFLLPILALF